MFFCLSAISVLALASTVNAQSRVQANNDSTLYWIVLTVLFIALAGTIFYWWKSKNAAQAEEAFAKSKRTVRISGTAAKKPLNSPEKQARREEREVEAWIQEQAQIVQNSVIGPKDNGKNPTNGKAALSAKNGEVLARYGENIKAVAGKIPLESLPIFKITQLIPVGEPESLPYVDDENLEDAIIQIRQEDDDEEVREVAVRVLSAFRVQNAVDYLAQVAHYDLSQRLRVAAVMALSEFDHPAVFEPILIACADPSREVKAAAARALIKLSFYRGDSFSRILQSHDTERIRLAALACMESGLAERAFERLLSTDYRQAYEAFVILSVLLKAGQSEELLRAIELHRAPQVRLAVLRVLEVLNPENLDALLMDLSSRPLTPEIRRSILEIMQRTAIAV